jgi:hypothetical protein
MFNKLIELETSDNDENELENVVVIDEKENKSELHYLNRQWDLWYHDPNNSDYSLNSYINIGTIDTIEKFWHYFHQLKLTQLQNGMFFIMLKGVYPTWEDNLQGGFWSFKIDKKEISQAWVKLSIYLLADNFIEGTDSEEYNLLKKEIIGISISPKKTFSILKVWLNNDSLHKKIKLKKELPFINIEEIMYRSHVETKEKEEQIKNSTTEHH